MCSIKGSLAPNFTEVQNRSENLTDWYNIFYDAW